MAKIKAIELRAIKHHKTLSEETPAYTATVYVNGRKAFDVMNHGRGGGDYQRPLGNVPLDKINAYCAGAFPPLDMEKYGGENVPCDLELWCHRMLHEYEAKKIFKRDLKSKIIILEGGEIYHYGFKRRGGPLTAQHLDHLREILPEALNLLPFDEAWAKVKPLMCPF